MNNNEVSYKDYRNALKAVNNKLYGYQLEVFPNKVIRLVEIYETSLDFEPVSLGINWAAIGTVDPEETMKFARMLQKAATLVKEFKYNGFKVVY